MSNRLLSISCLAAMAALGLSCKKTTRIRNVDHCVFNGGDSYCAAEYPDTPLCNAGQGVCAIGDPIGCVAEVRPGCHAPCGDPEDTSCLDGSSSGTDSGSDTEGSSGATGETEGSSSSDGGMTTTGDMPCMGDEDCTDSAAPFCNPAGECVHCGSLADGNAACADADPGRPVCDAGGCVACTEQDPGACGGQTPVCGEDNLCQACTEHSQCPGTACHLDGPQVGACFDASEVVMASSTAQLEAAFAGVGAGDDVVIILTGMDYAAAQVSFAADAEIAVIGDGSQLISGSDANPIISNGGPSIVYLAGLAIGGNATGDGLACSGTSVWLDDSEVRNNAQIGLDISSGCAAHLRRSVVRANTGGGVNVDGASLVTRNSAISSNFGSNAGIRIISGAIDASYTTIVGNNPGGAAPDSMQCFGATGSVRNSIVRGEIAPSISGCSGGGLVWEFNSVDTAGLGATNSNDGAWMSSWFAMPDMGDYHLTTSGEMEFADVATWQEGDPLTDIDGQPIPTAMPSFPGYDQP